MSSDRPASSTPPSTATDAVSGSAPASPAPLDWVIVGGGIHGVHLAARLIGEAGVPPERLRIIDPGPQLLHEWQRCSGNTGMRFLRSPGVHHLDLDPWSLLTYAGARGRRQKSMDGLFAAPYERPSLKLFNQHAAEVIARYRLQDLHIRDVATALSLSCERVSVQLGGGSELQARQVLLAVGASAQPRWPDWASSLRSTPIPIHHLFERDFVLEPETLPHRIAVIGGGISGVQAALRLAKAGREVHVIARHALRKHQFDSDPGWVGPKNMRRFSATADMNARREMIRAARHTGSVPPDLHRVMRHALRRGELTWLQGEITAATLADSAARLEVGHSDLTVDAVILATGFEARRPGGELVDRLVSDYDLPCARCGFPIVDTHLRWHPRVFVTGPLAELQAGPVSRNIVGARRAAQRILAAPRSPAA